ncbi:hypothetical protein BB559_002503 [Furculomyces boomerangus]|uniref:Major facilitator superfamily (MFS) profile domain-containing protein n=2 Tax=Harpellales TaxID=61421 RepID=A0A2T9YUW7_9FUNG|nr:hypothetical protein BB559_002503 [Furculomyces boomerangus]PWA02375.1 hypothetical protein BB558_001473 [Smittium angustum]
MNLTISDDQQSKEAHTPANSHSSPQLPSHTNIKNISTVSLKYENEILNQETDEQTLEENLPPTDGKQAFIILIFCVLINIGVVGIINVNGIYQTFYLKEFPNDNASLIGLIGTLSLSMMLLFSVLATPLSHFIGYRKTTWLGGVICVAGMVLASFGNNAWQLAITQGFIFGLGAALPFLCSIIMVSIWFDKYRGIGIGTVNAGAGLGGMAASPIVQLIIDKLGFRWSLRIVAIFSFTTVFISGFFIKPRRTHFSASSKSSRIFDKAAVVDPFVILVGISCFLESIAFTIPVYYLPTIINDRGGSDSMSTLSIVLANLGEIIGGLFFGIMADKFGELNVVLLANSLIAILIPTVWLLSTGVIPLLILILFYGILIASYLAAIPSSLGRHYGDIRSPGVISVVFVYFAVGFLSGGPIGGLLFDTSKSQGSYKLIALAISGLNILSVVVLAFAYLYIKKKSPVKIGWRL